MMSMWGLKLYAKRHITKFDPGCNHLGDSQSCPVNQGAQSDETRNADSIFCQNNTTSSPQ